MREKNDIIYYIFISIIAVILLLTLIFFTKTEIKSINFYDRLIVGFIFILCCIIGISLSLYPTWYKKILNMSINEDNNKINKPLILRRRVGHHPNCDSFKNHVVKINNKIICTGCLGLFIGCIISIFLMFLYIIIFKGTTLVAIYLFIFLALIMISFNFIEIVLSVRNKIIHIISNILLVIGFFLIIIGVFEITQTITFTIIGFIMIFLWFDTRVQLSVRCHKLICKNCKEKCKMY